MKIFKKRPHQKIFLSVICAAFIAALLLCLIDPSYFSKHRKLEFTTVTIDEFPGTIPPYKNTIVKTHIQNDRKNYDLSDAALLKMLERYVSTYEDPDSPIISQLHFELARFYLRSGQETKAMEHFFKISVSGTKINLLQIYTGMILEAAVQNNDESIFSIVNQSSQIAKSISAIRSVPVRFGTRDPGEKFTKEALCKFAAKSFANISGKRNNRIYLGNR